MAGVIHLSERLAIDAVEYASRANAILGIRDSGKTYTATMIAEQLIDNGIPFFAFDPIGRWRFLRVPGSRGGIGYPVVVAGGAKPDIDLAPETVADIIRAALVARVSVVLDLYSVQLSKAAWRTIVRNSINAILYESEGFGQRHVFLEEAAEFIPQRVIDGQTYAAVEKLARMGGNIGIGVTLINQRAEEVNKAVLELCDNLLLHRQRGKNSLLSLRKWLDASNIKTAKEVIDSLANLPTGQCWAWLKDLLKPVLIKVRAKHSFDPDRRAMARGHSEPAIFASAQDAIARLKRAMGGDTVPAMKNARHQVEKIVTRGVKAEEKQVNEKEASALRDENASLKRRIAELERKSQDVPVKYDHHEPSQIGNIDEIYEIIKRRLIADAPKVLGLLAIEPEITLTVERPEIKASAETLYGLCALLIAEKFFDITRSGADTCAEVQRRGKRTAAPNVYKELDKLTEQGFLTKEARGAYRAVEKMKINIAEA